MKKYDFAIIFDMDGVLVDNIQFHKKAWELFCEKYNFNLTDSKSGDWWNGQTNHEILNRLFKKKLTKEEVDKYAREKELLYRKAYAKYITPVKGLINFLEILKKNGIITAIATAAPSQNVKFVLQKIGAKKFFNTIVNDSYIKKGKPHPEIYLKTAREIKFKPARCIVVEDSLGGIQSGKNAKMKVIGITTTYSKKDLVKADFIIKDFIQVNLKLLESILNK